MEHINFIAMNVSIVSYSTHLKFVGTSLISNIKISSQFLPMFVEIPPIKYSHKNNIDSSFSIHRYRVTSQFRIRFLPYTFLYPWSYEKEKLTNEFNEIFEQRLPFNSTLVVNRNGKRRRVASSRFTLNDDPIRQESETRLLVPSTTRNLVARNIRCSQWEKVA